MYLNWGALPGAPSTAAACSRCVALLVAMRDRRRDPSARNRALPLASCVAASPAEAVCVSLVDSPCGTRAADVGLVEAPVALTAPSVLAALDALSNAGAKFVLPIQFSTFISLLIGKRRVQVLSKEFG